MYQSGRAGDEAKKRKSPAKSGRVGIYANVTRNAYLTEPCKGQGNGPTKRGEGKKKRNTT